MKTPEEFLDSNDVRIIGLQRERIIKSMKEYAKQWIERAAKVGREYPYGEAITESIMDIKKEIDAQ